MHFNLVTVKVWSGFELWRLLEGGAYSDFSINDIALIRGCRLFEARYLLEEIRYSNKHACLRVSLQSLRKTIICIVRKMFIESEIQKSDF